MSMLFRLRPDSGRSLIIRTTRLLICGALLSLSGLIQAADRDPVTLTLAEAFARVLSDNPELAMYPYDIRAAEARALQAGFRPNPQVSLDVENIVGGGQPLPGSGANPAPAGLCPASRGLYQHRRKGRPKTV